MPRKVWKDEYYLKVFLLARAGMQQEPISRALGLNWSTFTNWLQTRPALRDAWQQGNAAHKGGASPEAVGGGGWQDYIYKQLPPNVQAVWDKLCEYRREADGAQRIEAMLQDQGVRARQYLFIHALVCNNFCKSRACNMVGISRKTMETWITTDHDFAQLCSELEWHRDNFIEKSLMDLVNYGDSPATIFAAKTKLRKRGYNEKTEINITQEQFDLADLDIPTPVLDMVLSAMRKRQEAIAAL